MPSSSDAFAEVSISVEQRVITNADIRRLVELGGNLAPGAVFDVEEHSGGGSFTLRLTENVETGVGGPYVDTWGL